MSHSKSLFLKYWPTLTSFSGAKIGREHGKREFQELFKYQI